MDIGSDRTSMKDMCIEKKKDMLAAAVMRNDYNLCDELLQHDLDVNVPIGRKQQPSLILAAKHANVKMVKHLCQYKNEEKTLVMALELALRCGPWHKLEIIQPLVEAGAYTLSPTLLGNFFKENEKNPARCRHLLDIICECGRRGGWRKLEAGSPLYKLLGTMLRMAVVIRYRLDLDLDADHRYMPGWTNYDLIYHLLLHGANASSQWEPYVPDNYLLTSRTSVSIMPMNPRIFCLYLRTSVGQALPPKIESVFARYISVEIKFPESDDDHILNLIELMVRLFLWCGISLQHMKLYEMAKSHHIAIPRTNTRVINAYNNINRILDKTRKAHQLLSLQQSCRLCLQRNIRGPNLLYSLNTYAQLPKSMKDLITLDNTREVQMLETCDTMMDQAMENQHTRVYMAI